MFLNCKKKSADQREAVPQTRSRRKPRAKRKVFSWVPNQVTQAMMGIEFGKLVRTKALNRNET